MQHRSADAVVLSLSVVGRRLLRLRRRLRFVSAARHHSVPLELRDVTRSRHRRRDTTRTR